MVEVSFADGEARGDKILGSDRIYVRVMELMAQLFGPTSWTSIPHEALKAGKGLRSWLAAYYRTHSAPYPHRFDQLYEMTGSTCAMPKFKYQLKTALATLSKLEVPDEIRVSNVEWGDLEVTVHMARWTG